MGRVVSAVMVLALTSMVQATAFNDGEPPPMDATVDAAYGPDPAQKLDVYRPRGATAPRPAVLWFHGGGWQSGDKGADLNGIRDLAPALVSRGYVAISCNYRLAPAHRHPAQVNDAARAVRWVRAHAATLGVDPNRVGAVGISAGGHLACMLAVHAPSTGDPALDRFKGTVDAAVSLNGVSDLRAGSPTNALLQRIYPEVVGDDPKALADMSPITFATDRAAPLLLVVGDKDNMVPIAQSRIMADALKKAGAECEFLTIPGAGHGIFPSSTPEARDASLDFFDRRLKPTKQHERRPGHGRRGPLNHSPSTGLHPMTIHAMFACAALVLASLPQDREPVATEPGFSYLYRQGDPLAQGWKMVGPGAIKEEAEGILVTSGGMGMLWFSDSRFKDFTLRVDYKLTKQGDNSGVFVRFPDAPADPWDAVKTGYEIQICDGADPEHRTGAIYSFKAAEKTPNAHPAGEWNTYEITVKGQDYTISLNGQVINHYKGSRGADGYIGLQNHDGNSIVRFRNVRIKPD